MLENGVLLVERWILAALRHHRFFALAELNQKIGELLEKLNHRPFRKREGTRASLFAELDRPALQPLPAERYVIASWKTVRANIDYHVEVDRHYYSVPYQLAGQQMEARFTATTVEIFHLGKRVASHRRSSAAYQHTVIREHMPKSHQAHLEWTPSRLIHWAETAVGQATAQVVRTILDSRPHPEMGYRACLGIMSLGKTYVTAAITAAGIAASPTGIPAAGIRARPAAKSVTAACGCYFPGCDTCDWPPTRLEGLHTIAGLLPCRPP